MVYKRALAGLVVCVGLAGVQGCSRKGTPTQAAPLTPVATQPADSSTQAFGSAGEKCFCDAKYNFSVNYPADWLNEPESDNELTISPPNVKADDNQVLIQAPSLPPLASMVITLGMVQNGYLNDLKSREHNVVVQQTEPGNIPDAKSRVITITGDNLVAKAVMIIHGNKVFMLVSEVQPAQAELASRTVDAMADSWKWTK